MSEYIQNKYGKVFKIEKYNLDGRPYTERTMYICTNCHNFYICKESVIEHNCNTISITTSTEKKYIMMKQLNIY